MSKDFILPDIGEGIVECEIIEWRVKEGDLIEEDQPVADVSTDKAVVEIPSMHNGRVVKLYYEQGDIAKVHSPLFAIDIDEGGNGDKGGNGSGGEGAAAVAEAPQAAAVAQPATAIDKPAAAHQQSAAGGDKVLTTPAVRRIARENAITLSLVPGTGKNGRILKEDVLNYIAGAGTPAAAGAGTAPLEPEVATPVTDQARDRVEPIQRIKAVMAKRMVESVSTIPHFTYVDEVDITELVALRLQLKEKYAAEGIKLTMMPLFMKALSLALKEYPIINSQVNEAFTELYYKASHNIGMAVDAKVGLLVPNVKNVQNLSILEIAAEVTRLTEVARAGRVSPEDLKGGTITISNVGAIGGTAATPLITKPEVAIVALGKVQELPRFDAAGQVVARKIMTVSWSGDHRVIDGGTIARFCNQWKEYLEQPASMLVAMS
ncbi:dihydrolipoyllysine-residue acetyltransferase [Exilibacterium tricleocarpae]|uniref:Dihydrolipoamide acetyltransferase component of pyruvate dehydrogenase complex n=1 Tax=Exilibacterium tricleocarpae TaxID=2591008 RepID=A0A545U5H5_9GAMM|nr:2-oxo acid dehydrogenase subunit E2 [Exilibacterium tricleocarpae]TQV84712.1 dihydrolipoyllysine-residue acetyltransferase [Exilibacterium tricleocarpae]